MGSSPDREVRPRVLAGTRYSKVPKCFRAWKVEAKSQTLSSLHTANLSWRTRVGKPKLVCVNGTKPGGKHICKLLASNGNVFVDCFYAVHTHQLEFANFSLPCEGRFTITELLCSYTSLFVDTDLQKMTLRARNVSGTLDKQAPGSGTLCS